jgi:3-oxoacyl-[acyl-carrier-protein] synthase II
LQDLNAGRRTTVKGDGKRVVITGLGAITPLGGDVASTWSAMLAGKSGVRALDDWPEEIPVKIAAAAAVDPVDQIGRVQARRLDRCEQLALVAAREAWQHAGAPQVAPERLGVAVSSGIGGLSRTVEAYDALNERGWKRLSPFTTAMLMANGAAGWISIELGARAGVHAPVGACASGTEAIGYGMAMIRSGRADVVVAGGTEAPVIPLAVAAFTKIRALSYRNEEPQRASRPFDKNRDGFVLGEGAGIVVLESGEHAARRGAGVLAVAAGVGYSADAFHLTQTDPAGSGPALAIQRALADAGLAAEQVVHINAHATSTPAGDSAEAAAIRRALGAATSTVVVSATKSMTGHLLGGGGAAESVAAICALRDKIAPPTVNLDDLDDQVAEAGLDVATEARDLRIGPGAAVLNNSFGFGGHNVTLAFMA